MQIIETIVVTYRAKRPYGGGVEKMVDYFVSSKSN